MEQVRLYLSRHGETLENQRHVLQGQLPGTLSERGLEQARGLAERMEGVELDAVVASDLERSRRTAEIVAERKGLAVDVTPLLREMDWGEYTGQALVDVDWFHLPPSVEQVEALYRSLRPIIDKDLIYFAFYKEQPIGFFLMFPEINQAVKHLDGKMNLWGMLKFMYYRHVKRIDVALGQLFGVVPEFQGKGVEAAMIKRFTERIVEQKSDYEYLELNWVGEFNPPMIHLMEYIGAKVARTHITYRKLFRDDIEFVRSVDKTKE